MHRYVLGFLVVLAFAGMSFAAVSIGDWSGTPSNPGIDATGGPDLYGYIWKDSAEPGVVYNWKDISTTGTLVTGIGDDNYVGPYAIGFTFKYYWYDVSQYWIGSNGYLKFGTPANISQTFPASIPLPALPNDFAAIYMADWQPDRPAPANGRTYRWNNADSLVVSFTNYCPWVGPGVTDGVHNFQIILSRLDSSITFQYGAQSGTVSNTDILIGIENVSGQVGLERSHDTYPASNYKVYFDYPATTTYIAHDMSTVSSANLNSEGICIRNGSTVTPWVKVKNVGNQTENSFTVNCTIQQVGGAIVYNQTVTRGPLAPGAELEVTFTPNWTPTTNATYSYKGAVVLAGDMNPNNDIKISEALVMAIPGTMYFDDGTNEQAWSWQGGNGGLGQHFVPPVYPAKIDSIRFFIAGTGTSPFSAQILDDNGPGGLPGTVLFTQTVNTPTANQWYGVNTSSQNITFADGGFYLAWIMVDSLTAPIGTDSTGTQPKSRQGWEYTGVWGNYRNIEIADIMIRCRISQPGGAQWDINTSAVRPPVIIPANGGSFPYNISVHNLTSTTLTATIWNKVRDASNVYYQIFGPLSRVLPGGANPSRVLNQTISGALPSGTLYFISYIGTYPSSVQDSSFFTITKSAVADGGPWISESYVTGDVFDEYATTTTSVPDQYSLNQNYPNPFNPLTTISFSLPQVSAVKLMVFDVTGREVATLVNGMREAGVHSVSFDASNLASGIYLCKLEAGEFSAVQKMVLMK
ncbi:MAG: T9SS type A sorting domain-containing protein [bacterium]|nr:T9SS type A sorting domain-containing protein [bacterium]